MKIVLFLLLAAVFVIVSWIVLGFLIFISRALTHTGKPAEWHAQHASAGVSLLHVIASLALGIWLAYRIALT